MNDAEARFAERLAADLDQVLGVGIVIDDLELAVAEDAATVVATLLIDGRVERIEAAGPDLISLYRPLVQRAAEVRLASAFWQMIGPG
ncbi:MAG TPA: hypothetical protein VFO73_10745 [Candidatus Limnocylindrales bacterium]|nr:hypothetical protein [Candidatus Limnocylindrales bacterium]